MVTRSIPFYCSECQKRFMGIAAEWQATAFTAPVKCPRCGSMHTRPWSIAPARLANKQYEGIWETIDKQK